MVDAWPESTYEEKMRVPPPPGLMNLLKSEFFRIKMMINRLSSLKTVHNAALCPGNMHTLVSVLWCSLCFQGIPF